MGGYLSRPGTCCCFIVGSQADTTWLTMTIECVCGSHATPKDAHVGQSVLEPCEFDCRHKRARTSSRLRRCEHTRDPCHRCTRFVRNSWDDWRRYSFLSWCPCCENKHSTGPQFRDTLCRGGFWTEPTPEQGCQLAHDRLRQTRMERLGGARDDQSGPLGLKTAEARLRSCASST